VTYLPQNTNNLALYPFRYFFLLCCLTVLGSTIMDAWWLHLIPHSPPLPSTKNCASCQLLYWHLDQADQPTEFLCPSTHPTSDRHNARNYLYLPQTQNRDQLPDLTNDNTPRGYHRRGHLRRYFLCIMPTCDYQFSACESPMASGSCCNR